MDDANHKFRNFVTHVKSFLAGLLLGGLGLAVAMLLLAPPRTGHVWRLTRSPDVSPPV
jgi:hypothetical protein